MSMEEISFSQMTTFGDHLYRRNGEIAEIIMENTRTGIRKTIVGDDGMIADFPGFAYPKLVSRYSDGIPTARISFRSDISRLGEQYALIWQIQPDGRYWEDDDGFGGTSDDEIDLYARMDETGHFIEPFHFYSIGSSKLYGTGAEEQLMQTLQMKGDPLASLRAHPPDACCHEGQNQDAGKRCGNICCSGNDLPDCPGVKGGGRELVRPRKYVQAVFRYRSNRVSEICVVGGTAGVP